MTGSEDHILGRFPRNPVALSKKVSVIPKDVPFPDLDDRCPKCDEFLWGYGISPHHIVTSPLHFRPDPECSRIEEIARWQLACYAVIAGEELPSWSGMGTYWWGDRHEERDGCDGIVSVIE